MGLSPEAVQRIGAALRPIVADYLEAKNAIVAGPGAQASGERPAPSPKVERDDFYGDAA